MAMILNCPFCGHPLEQHLRDGLAGCLRCHRTFDSSPTNLILATAWHVRKRPSTCVDRVVAETKVPEPVAAVALALVVECGYSHEDCLRAVKTIGVR
jgi:hypothetical protein